jgi:hypothetical protein
MTSFLSRSFKHSFFLCVLGGLALAGCGGSGSSDNATSTMQTYTNAVTELRASGYRVAQGNAFLFTNSDCPTFVAIFNSCFGNNSAAPYVVPQPPTEGSYVDPDYAAPLNTPGPNGQNTNIVYRLSDNDALITVVSFPPKGAYFGYQSYVFTSAISNYPVSKPLQVVAPHGSNPPSRYELFASIGNDVNNAVVQNQFQSPWDGQVVVYVSTPNQVLANDLIQQLSANGVNAKAILIEKLGANVRTGNGPAADDLVTLIRYAEPQNQSAADIWLGNLSANVKVYKVSKTTPVSRYPTNRYTPRSSNSEALLREPLRELTGILNGWLATVQSAQTIESQEFSPTTLYNPLTQTPSGLVGSDCIENGTICAGDNQDTYTYALSPKIQLGSNDTMVVAGVNHNLFSNSSYISLAIYNAAEAAGVASASQTNPDAVGFDSGSLTGSAEAVLRELGLYNQASTALKAALPRLYVSLISRNCSYALNYCVSLDGTTLIPAGANINMYERAYLRPGDTTAADLNNMLRPYVISGGIQP